uniref:TetR/AcrR family transcriptional regulator n=1 Tax=Corynebacterium sp. 52A TaxID=2080502 RepID=UPI001CEFAB0E|nr:MULTISPECIES: TetR/AcrR family transcriptional regulator [Corynebacterium]
MVKRRMTGKQRREQLVEVGRTVFAERGLKGTSVEEIASRAGVSKPVVYEHFGGKEGLYAEVVDRDTQLMRSVIENALNCSGYRRRVESAVMAFLSFVEDHTDEFTILTRDVDPEQHNTYSTLLNDTVGKVSYILAGAFEKSGLNPDVAVLYGQALVGMASSTAQWWLDVREPSKEVVAAHIVNLCWNGLAGMVADPSLRDPELKTVGENAKYYQPTETPEALQRAHSRRTAQSDSARSDGAQNPAGEDSAADSTSAAD